MTPREYFAQRSWVARHRPGTLRGATLAKRAEVCRLNGWTAAQYDRAAKRLADAALDADPHAVLDACDAGLPVDDLLAGWVAGALLAMAERQSKEGKAA